MVVVHMVCLEGSTAKSEESMVSQVEHQPKLEV